MPLKLKNQTMLHIVYVVKVQGIHTNFLILAGGRGGKEYRADGKWLQLFSGTYLF